MSHINVKFPDTYIDAKDMVVNALEQGGRVSIRAFKGLFANLCDVTHYHIEEVEDEEGYSNMDILLTYKIRSLSTENGPQLLEKTRKLRVLTAQGDNSWTYRMIDKIWEGDYPSTVAVDMASGEVFLFGIKMNRIELIEFGQFDQLQFESFKLDVSDREPFSIKIDPNAMFEYIDGAEGINHLQRNIIVEFNCGLPIQVRNGRREVLV